MKQTQIASVHRVLYGFEIDVRIYIVCRIYRYDTIMCYSMISFQERTRTGHMQRTNTNKFDIDIEYLYIYVVYMYVSGSVCLCMCVCVLVCSV